MTEPTVEASIGALVESISAAFAKCACGEPESAPHHKIGGCECRWSSHVFGCHYLPWHEEQIAAEAQEVDR